MTYMGVVIGGVKGFSLKSSFEELLIKSRFEVPVFFRNVDNLNISAVGGSFTIGLHGLHGLIHEHFFTFNTYYMIASACLYILVIIQLSIGM